MLLLPKKLRRGDTVALVAPAFPCTLENLAKAVALVHKWGLRTKVMPGVYQTNGYFAGDDATRAKDLMDAFADPHIKGIFCVRGGYGTQRLLPMLKYAQIAENPKIFAGFSDITALHTVFNQLCGLVTFHAPMVAAQFAAGEVDTFTEAAFLGSVMKGHPHAALPPLVTLTPAVPAPPQPLTLCGGNLTLLAATIGTPYEINTHGKILFLEEVDEEPYRTDRLLMQLKQSGKLGACAAILLGHFSGDFPQQAVQEILLPLGKPVYKGFPCGHALPNLTLPMGAQMHLSEHPRIIY